MDQVILVSGDFEPLCTTKNRQWESFKSRVLVALPMFLRVIL